MGAVSGLLKVCCCTCIKDYLCVNVSGVRFQLSHFQVTSLSVSVRRTKVRDVTLEGQRHSEIIQAPGRSQLSPCECECSYLCVCVHEPHLEIITVKVG